MEVINEVSLRPPIRLGVVGAGMVSQIAHLPAIAAAKGLELAAIADLDEKLAGEIARRYRIERIYASDRQLLEDSDIDAVAIIIHRHKTEAAVRDALLSGKHVFSEKPMAMTLGAANELAALARQRSLVYAVGFMKRYDAGVLQARLLLGELKDSMRLGRLVHVRGKNFCAEYVGNCEDYIKSEVRSVNPVQKPNAAAVPEWLNANFAACYDWFANVGLHSLNLLRYLLDCDLAVRHAQMHWNRSVSIILNADKIPVSLDVGRAATGRWEESFEFFFERGRLELQLTSLKQRDRRAAVRLDENLGTSKTSYWGHDNPGSWSFANQMQAFADALSGDEDRLLASGEDSVKDMELLERIFKLGQDYNNG